MGPEMLLQYMWEHRLYDSRRCTTTDGLPISIIDPGLRNSDAGPDFFNAKVQIGDRLWAGNVEIHTRASEWHRHGHDSDPAYATVILHVVAESDCLIQRPDGTDIPQMVLHYVPDFRERYLAMVERTDRKPACADELATTPAVYITEWVSALGFERLHTKADRVRGWLRLLEGDWQAVAYVAVARALGFGTNSDAFELLARSTPLRHLMRHSNDPELLAAALFGQAGFLDEADVEFDSADEAYYRERMYKNYHFLRGKYGWDENAPRPVWRLARMRPPNFPHRRIAVLVALLSGGFKLGRMLGHIDSLDTARDIFNVKMPPYWADHYDFGRRTSAVRQALSAASVNTLIINAVVPLMYAYAEAFADERLADRAVDMLMDLPAESNFITRDFAAATVAVQDAFTSQALIQLHNEYCRQHKCIFCRLGHRYLAAKATPGNPRPFPALK